MTIWYLEDGFQTKVPAAKRRFYRGRENDRAPVRARAPVVRAQNSEPAPAAPDQVSQLRAALLLAYCQPAVGAFFNFELVDERRLAGWQSGLLYADGTRKPSYGPFKQIVAAVRSGQVDCAEVLSAASP